MIKLTPKQLQEAIKGVPVPQHYEAIQKAVLKNVKEWVEERGQVLLFDNIPITISLAWCDWQALKAKLEEK